MPCHPGRTWRFADEHEDISEADTVTLDARFQNENGCFDAVLVTGLVSSLQIDPSKQALFLVETDEVNDES